MSSKKSQHYVPKMYLRRFANSNRHFSVLNVSTKEIISNVPCDYHCQKNYFYDINSKIEDYLAERENVWRSVFWKVDANQDLTEEDICSLKEFAVFQRLRTEASAVFAEKGEKQLILETARMICAYHNWKFDDSIKDLCEKKLDEKRIPAQNILLAQNMVPRINDLHCLIIDYNTTNSLISSDAPVISLNPFDCHNTGYSVMGLVLLFPINSHTLVVLFDKTLYSKFSNETRVTMTDEEEIQALNNLQLISAERIVFGVNTDELTYFDEKAWDLRNKNQSQKPVTALGSATEKMMIARNNGIIFDYDFSFAHLNHRIIKIPSVCREAGPRQYSCEWEQKYRIKTSFPDILFRNKEVNQQLDTPIGEYRKGYFQMQIFPPVRMELPSA